MLVSWVGLTNQNKTMSDYKHSAHQFSFHFTMIRTFASLAFEPLLQEKLTSLSAALHMPSSVLAKIVQDQPTAPQRQVFRLLMKWFDSFEGSGGETYLKTALIEIGLHNLVEKYFSCYTTEVDYEEMETD